MSREIKKLKVDYRKIKDNNNESGRARRSTKVYEVMDEILGCRPATLPPILVDTLAEDPCPPAQADQEEEEEALSCSATTLSTPTSCSSEVSDLSTRADCNGGSSQTSHSSTTSSKGNGVKRRREEDKSKGREGRMKEMMESLMVTMKETRETDSSLLVEMEEKRMKYEDQRLREREYEERRLQEREYEEKRRREESVSATNDAAIDCFRKWTCYALVIHKLP
jgi:hypothetical protein